MLDKLDKRVLHFIDRRSEEFETGYDNPVSFDKNLSSIYETLNLARLDKPSKIKRYYFSSKAIPVKRAQSILINLFNFHDIYMCPKEPKYNVETERLTSEDSIIKIHPFDLPIKFVGSGDYFGEISHSLEDDKIFYKINLGSKRTDLTSAVYAHELTHTQCDTLKTIGNYKDSEVMPILIELITALNVNEQTLREMIRKRLSEMRSNIRIIKCFSFNTDIEYRNNEYINALEASKYMLSTLQALKVFEKYKNGSVLERQVMQRRINSVLNNKKTLHDFLVRYSIDQEKAKDSDFIFKLVKEGKFHDTK